MPSTLENESKQFPKPQISWKRSGPSFLASMAYDGILYQVAGFKWHWPRPFGCLGDVGNDGWLITSGLTGKSHLFQVRKPLSDNYVAEKLGLEAEEAKATNFLICAATGRQRIESRYGHLTPAYRESLMHKIISPDNE